MLLIGLSVSSVHADFKELDKIFLEGGVVDKNYKYIDKKLAARILTEVNNELADSLPIKIDANTEITSIFHSPSFAMYSYTFNLDEMRGDLPLYEFMKQIREYFSSVEFTKDLCKDSFGAKFQQVNGYTSLLNLNDVSGEKIIDITLNEETCPLTDY